MLTLMFFFAAMVIMRSIPSARASSGLKGMTSSLTAPASSLLKSRRLSMISSKSSQLPRAVVTKSRCSLFFFFSVIASACGEGMEERAREGTHLLSSVSLRRLRRP